MPERPRDNARYGKMPTTDELLDLAYSDEQ